MKSLRLPAFAKLNECLYVLGRRPDGFHELRTIFQTIGLHDVLEVRLGRGAGIELECDDPAIPAGRGNLVWRAVAAARRALGVGGRVCVRLEKRIPVGRGLGGGSSDAAVALMAMERLSGRKLDPAQRVRIAMELGSDVPFFLRGGRALGMSRGEELYPLAEREKCFVAVVSPAGIAVNTREAYEWLRAPALTSRGAASKLRRFCARCWSGQGNSLENDFEGAVFRRHPRLARIRSALLEQGAAGAALAGSGSAVFGEFQSPAQARRTAILFPDDQVFITETVTREEYLRALQG